MQWHFKAYQLNNNMKTPAKHYNNIHSRLGRNAYFLKSYGHVIREDAKDSLIKWRKNLTRLYYMDEDDTFPYMVIAIICLNIDE